VNASVAKQFKWGSATLSYDRGLGVAGGLGGTAENESLAATVSATSLLRNLVVTFTPRYQKSSGTSTSQGTLTSDSDIRTITLNLAATYQIARFIALVGSYTFYQQRSSGTGFTTVTGPGGNQIVTGGDIDQNRVFLGLQFAYPVNVY
jgi:hypothetical protein